MMKNCIDIFLKCDIDNQQKETIICAHEELKRCIKNYDLKKEFLMDVIVVVYERKILSYDAFLCFVGDLQKQNIVDNIEISIMDF
jgi:hypothetical protein